MLHSIAPRYRRGRGAHARARKRPVRWQPLLERDRELEQLGGLLDDARAGMGAAALIDAPAGMGKSRLLSLVGDMGREAGMCVLEAAGKELERRFRFGVAIQLFEPLWLECPAERRAALTTGPARPARTLLDDPCHEPGHDVGHDELIHALFHLAANLISSEQHAQISAPLVLIADDLHHADSESLRLLAYLSARLPELPVALVMATRSGSIGPDPTALNALRHAARGRLIHPTLITPQGVREIVQGQFAGAPDELWAACAHLTGGNPWLLAELLAGWEQAELPAVTATAERLRKIVPLRVQRAVAAQLEAMDGPVTSTARAIAILGDGASVRRVSLVADLDADAVLRAAAEMASADLLRPGTPLSFARPLIRSAVIASVSAFERARLHRRAAAVLMDDRAGAEEVAVHLLEAPPGSDINSIGILREAARSAAESGDAERAVHLLERALAEHSPDEVRGELLADLAGAEAQIGSSQASERLREAATISRHPQRRAELLLAQGQALCAERRYREAAAVLDAGLTADGIDDRRLFDELTAAYVVAESLVDRPDALLFERRDAMVEALGDDPTALQRAAIAHSVLHDSLQGTRRETVRRLAELAWDDGQFTEIDRPDSLGWPLLPTALLFADELERCLEISDPLLGGSSGQPWEAEVRHARAWARFEQGRVAEARVDAQAALMSVAGVKRTTSRTAFATIVSCHIECGQLAQADAVLDLLERHGRRESIGYALLLEVRARLRLIQHRPAEALADATEAGRALRAGGSDPSPGAVAWRSTAAVAHLALEQPDEARDLAEEELALARRVDLPRIMTRGLRVLGLATGGTGGLELLAEAVQTGDAHPPRLEHVRALIDFGAALRRANRRNEAREPLRRGLELAHKGGATVLAARAHSELLATGARPRRAALTGLDALTASERRVADLAPALTTRQIAQALFVTPKTVEFHLRNIYQKLDVSSRAELAQVMG